MAIKISPRQAIPPRSSDTRTYAEPSQVSPPQVDSVTDGERRFCLDVLQSPERECRRRKAKRVTVILLDSDRIEWNHRLAPL